MINVVIDTNVIISALNFGGKPKEILYLANKKVFKFFISPFIIEEVTHVLIKQFNWHEDKVKRAIQMIKEIASIVQPSKQLSFIKEKDSDNRILECALAANAHFLVTGDTKHILPFSFE